MATMLTLTGAAPADEYGRTPRLITPLGSGWVLVKYDSITLPTEDGECEAVYGLALSGLPGVIVSTPSLFVVPTVESPVRPFSTRVVHFHPLAYGVYVPDVQVWVRTDSADCHTVPVTYRLKVTIRVE